MAISDQQLEHWRHHGYVIIEGLLDDDEVAQARDEIGTFAPQWDEFNADRTAFPWHTVGTTIKEFPFAGRALNRVSTHPDLIDFLERAYGRSDWFLTQSLVWSKYAGTKDFDQAFHCDFDDNNLLVPDPQDLWPQVPMILYYTDVAEDFGPTFVVSRQHTDDRPLWPHMRERELDPELYDHEIPVTVKAGSIVIFSMRTFHRGSAFKVAQGVRHAQHIVFRTHGAEWQGWRALPRYGGSEEMDQVMTQFSPRQRELLGVPGPGHPFWNEATIAAVSHRYPEMDVAPYREAISSAHS